MWIIIFSLLMLVIALGIGWCFPKAGAWEWIDVIYYPLAICGVILLFLESGSIRQLAMLEGQRRDLSNIMVKIERTRPEGNTELHGKNLVRSDGEILANISKLNRICQRTTSADPVCFVVEYLSPIIAPGEVILLSYDGPEDLGDVCSAASNVFSEMAQSPGLPGFLTQPIADHYFEGLEKGFHPFEFDPVRSYLSDLRTKLEGKASNMVLTLNMSEEQRSLMEPIYEATIQWGMFVLFAFDHCLRAPENIRSGAYAKWVSNMREAKTEIEHKEEELRQIKINANELNPVAIFRVSYWPFLIILALALKFSKGVAALQKKHADS